MARRRPTGRIPSSPIPALSTARGQPIAISYLVRAGICVGATRTHGRPYGLTSLLRRFPGLSFPRHRSGSVAARTGAPWPHATACRTHEVVGEAAVNHVAQIQTTAGMFRVRNICDIRPNSTSVSARRQLLLSPASRQKTSVAIASHESCRCATRSASHGHTLPFSATIHRYLANA